MEEEIRRVEKEAAQEAGEKNKMLMAWKLGDHVTSLHC